MSEMAEADLEEMVRAVESAVASRMPNCDDVALIDRVVYSSEDEDANGNMSRWQAALGDPPSLSEAEEAVNSDSTWQVYTWFYPYFWVPLLPEAAASTWTGSEAFQLLIKKMPPSGRAEFDEIANKSPKPETSVRSGSVQFSLSADELSCMEPADAAREIASYPVAQDERIRETLILDSMLQGLVKADPSGWGDNPNRIAELLCHPTYISHYLAAFSTLEFEQLSRADVDGLVDTIVGVVGEPRLVEDRDSESADSDEYAKDWEEARRAAIWLLRQLLVTEVDLASRYEEMWDLLEREARAFPQSRVPTDGNEISPLVLRQRSDSQHTLERDPHHRAINQQNTHALDTALLLAAHEYEATSQVRPQITALIEWCLGISGEEGAKCRAIIAARIGFLLCALPDWLEENKHHLFSADVLGQMALDQVLSHAWPYEWICANYRSEIFDAARRGVDRSLDWILIAMLNSAKEYEPESVIEQLNARVPEACGVLVRMLDYPSTDEDISDDRADRFFELLLKGKQYARSLGWLSRVDAMPHDKWTDLTLRAMEAAGGEIDMPEQIIRRVFDNDPTEESIRILTRLIEVQCNPAHPLSAEANEDNNGHVSRATWNRITISNEAPKWLELYQPKDGSSDAFLQLRETLRRHGLTKDPTSE